MLGIGEGTVLTPCTEDVSPQIGTGLDVELHGQFYDSESGHDGFFNDANGGVRQLCSNSGTGELMSTMNYDEEPETFCANVSPPVPSAVLPHGNGVKADCKVYGDSKSEDAVTCDNYQENSIEVVLSLEGNSAVHQIINNSHESTNGENSEENIFLDGESVMNSLDCATLSNFGISELNSSHCESDSINVLDSTKECNGAETDASKIEYQNNSIKVGSFDLLDDIIADARNNKVILARSRMVNLLNIYIYIYSSFLKECTY